MDHEKLWHTALGELEVSLSKANYTTWFKGSFIAEITEHKAVLGVPNNFSKEWLRKKFHPQILSTLEKLTGGQVTSIEYIVAIHPAQAKETTSSPLIPKPVEKPTPPSKPSFNTAQLPKLNPNYTFAHFVVGSSNQMAHAAAVAVAANPGHAYNPLFVYGGVGLGKTHLIQAIAHQAWEKDPTQRIVYTSCEQFTNDFVDAVREGRATQFKHTYRETDMLLIDDIQFLAGKEGTQEEFFHTFNALHQQNKQIIITSDRPPKSIPTLEERLSSRFEWGLLVDINLPDVETRTAIIQSKCAEKQFNLDEVLINYLAHAITSNIREIEGALNHLMAYCELHKVPPSEEVIHTALHNYIHQNSKQSVGPGKIIKTVTNFFNITIDEILGPKRIKELVYARQIAMYLIRSELNLSYPLIGKEMGGKDHTTVIYACEKIEKEIKRNDQLQRDVTALKERLYAIPN
jgi:chromosomal replication initiator protein